MEENIMDYGLMVNNTELVFMLTQNNNQEKVNGKTEKELDGQMMKEKKTENNNKIIENYEFLFSLFQIF